MLFKAEIATRRDILELEVCELDDSDSLGLRSKWDAIHAATMASTAMATATDTATSAEVNDTVPMALSVESNPVPASAALVPKYKLLFPHLIDSVSYQRIHLSYSSNALYLLFVLYTLSSLY